MFFLSFLFLYLGRDLLPSLTLFPHTLFSDLPFSILVRGLRMSSCSSFLIISTNIPANFIFYPLRFASTYFAAHFLSLLKGIISGAASLGKGGVNCIWGPLSLSLTISTFLTMILCHTSCKTLRTLPLPRL